MKRSRRDHRRQGRRGPDESSIADLVRAAAGGSADILVYVRRRACAARSRSRSRRCLRDDFDAIVDVNLKGAFLFAKGRRPPA